MPLDAEGRWFPGLFPKQMEGMRLCQEGTQNLILFSGPRWSTKTVTCENVVPQHAWNTDRANICMLTITQSAGIDSGPWQHLTELYLPDWIAGNFGMKWVREPYIQGVTKKPACKISNKFDTVSTISLESLKNEDEVEARFKGKEYSMIWVNELSKFKKRRTFDILKDCLRMRHLRPEQHLFLADTNPDLDLGEKSWIYELWYKFRIADEDGLREMYPDIDPKLLVPLQKRLQLLEFTIDDNLALSEQKKTELLAEFSHDPDLVEAYYYGRWVQASADAIFYKVFRPAFHVIGEKETAVNKEPEIMVPEQGCTELVTGFDPGITNSAMVILEKAYATIQYIDPQGKQSERVLPILKYLDEVVIVGRPHSLSEFILEAMERMEFWERQIDRVGKTLWRHWSDRSVFDMKSPDSDKYFHQIIFSESHRAIEEGIVKVTAPIILEAAARGPGSVIQRIDLFMKLLYDERVFFSASRCHNLITSIKGLKRGTNAVQVIAKGSPLKHAFDAATYAAASELYDELRSLVAKNITNQRKASDESRMVVIPT